MKHLLVPTLLLLVSISQVQAQVETSPHEHTVTHGHGNYVDHIHTTTDHSHTVQPRDMETPEEALARHAAGAWHEDLLPGESSALLDHTGVPYLGPVLSDEVDDLFANDPHDPRIRLLHTHSFNHDDGQDHQHRHIYIHGHVSSGTCPGLNVCIHEHTDNVAQFRQHEDHVIGQEHIHWEQSGRVYDSHVVRHRDEHFHVAVHTHDGLLRHHHYLDHTHSYDRLHTTHDWHEAQALLPDGPIPSHRIINVTGAGQDVVDYTTHAHSSASSRSFDFVPDPESQKQEVDGSAKSDDAPPELTVSFTDVPAAHTGSVAFTLRAEFSEPVTTDETAMRDDVLVVIGGVAMDARRVDGRGGLWEITVEPDSDGEVQVFVAPDGACAEVSAVCTVDGRQLAMANWIGVIIPGPTEALTASFTDVPATHAGSSTFAFWIEFSDPLMTTGHGALRDDALVVTGGAVTHVREVDGLSDLWEITIAPDSEADVMILLVAERACTEAGAVCTSYGRRLANGPVAVIPGPPADEPSDEAPIGRSAAGRSAAGRSVARADGKLHRDAGGTCGQRHVHLPARVQRAGGDQLQSAARRVLCGDRGAGDARAAGGQPQRPVGDHGRAGLGCGRNDPARGRARLRGGGRGVHGGRAAACQRADGNRPRPGGGGDAGGGATGRSAARADGELHRGASGTCGQRRVHLPARVQRAGGDQLQGAARRVLCGDRGAGDTRAAGGRPQRPVGDHGRAGLSRRRDGHAGERARL